MPSGAVKVLVSHCLMFILVHIVQWFLEELCSGGATPADPAGRSTALAQALAPTCVLLCFGDSVNRK